MRVGGGSSGRYRGSATGTAGLQTGTAGPKTHGSAYSYFQSWRSGSERRPPAGIAERSEAKPRFRAGSPRRPRSSRSPNDSCAPRRASIGPDESHRNPSTRIPWQPEAGHRQAATASQTWEQGSSEPHHAYESFSSICVAACWLSCGPSNVSISRPGKCSLYQAIFRSRCSR